MFGVAIGTPHEAVHDLRCPAHSGKPSPRKNLLTGKIQILAGKN